MQVDFDVIIIGAGAAGLMCAATAGYRGKKVLVLDHAKQAGKKILISGGGRCNFTNMDVEPNNYLCSNPHFVKSALSRYTQWDFLGLIGKYQVPYHERDFGQLFCDDSAKDIVNILLSECDESQNVQIKLRTEIKAVEKNVDESFTVATNLKDFKASSLVIATGGLSMPKLGATPFGYKVAEQFGLEVFPTRAGLVPLTLHQEQKEQLAELSGISFPVRIGSEDNTSFAADMLITHRGLSGPAVLQISNYWLPGEKVSIDLLPSEDMEQVLAQAKQDKPEQQLKTLLSQFLPKRFIEVLIDAKQLPDKAIKQLMHKEIEQVVYTMHSWRIAPNGTEGYRTAEVTLGGIDTNQLSSKTMEAKSVKGLYFIGEVMDVTGWLGGYNFQWAWASGYACGQSV